MKSIGLSNEVYTKLLAVKHKLENKEERIISYDEVINKLIQGEQC